MSVFIDDILDFKELQHMCESGRVRWQTHTFFPYVVYSYSERAQHIGEWTNTERLARGLIMHRDTEEIIARPFAKFFNFGDSRMPKVFESHSQVVRVFDKLDGSLGVGYRTSNGEVAIATRGSFHSEQAEFATALIQHYYPNFQPNADRTALFEIIYPGLNVVDYGETRDVFYLGEVDIATGHAHFEPENFPGPCVSDFGLMTVDDARAMGDRENAEGLVLWHEETDSRVKLKQEDYIVKHRALWGLSARRVWEAQVNDDVAIGDLVASLPEEYRSWAKEEARRQAQEFLRVQSQVYDLARGANRCLTRREQAEYLHDSTSDKALFGMAFRALDGKDFERGVWDYVKP